MREEHRQRIEFLCECGDTGEVMNGRRISTTGLMTNRVRGVIHSCQVGLTRAGVRLRVGEANGSSYPLADQSDRSSMLPNRRMCRGDYSDR